MNRTFLGYREIAKAFGIREVDVPEIEFWIQSVTVEEDGLIVQRLAIREDSLPMVRAIVRAIRDRLAHDDDDDDDDQDDGPRLKRMHASRRGQY